MTPPYVSTSLRSCLDLCGERFNKALANNLIALVDVTYNFADKSCKRQRQVENTVHEDNLNVVH